MALKAKKGAARKRAAPKAPEVVVKRPVIDVAARFARMEKVAKRFEAWRPASEVLTKVSAVETRFVQLDRATRVGGWPIERVTTIHGPSNHGKTQVALGLGTSFLEGGHFFAFVDAEFTTPEDWLAELMRGQERSPGFVALRPRTFEQTVDAVREFCDTVGEARDKGDVEPDTSAIIVIDSVKKLAPDRLLSKILKEGATGKKGSIDGASGRGAQMRAALLSQWLDELVPMLNRTRTTIAMIAREGDDPNADQNDIKFDNAWKVQGGKALIYDASLVARVTRAKWLREGGNGDDEKGVVVGERTRVRIWKTKIGGKDDAYEDGFFHTSNGSQYDAGFDRSRDVVECAKEIGALDVSGSWLTWKGGSKRWNGEPKAVDSLRSDVGMLAALEAETRALIAATRRAP